MALIASVMASLSVFLLIFAFYVRQRRYRAQVEARLGVFEQAAEVPPVEPEPARKPRLGGMRNLDRLLRRLDLGQRTAVELQRAGSTLRVSEYLMLRVAAGLVPAAVVVALLQQPLIALVVGVVGFFVPTLWLRRMQQRRLQRIEKQLSGALGSIASGLRAGFGLMQSMQNTAQTIDDPLAGEFQHTIRDMQLGAGVDDALADLGERVGSYDLNIVITAIRVQQRTGGNLAEILDKVAFIMRERERIKGELRAMTAQARLSGLILTVLPVGLAVVLTLLSPDYMMPLFTDPLGRAMIGGAVVANIIGFLIIRKILAIRL